MDTFSIGWEPRKTSRIDLNSLQLRFDSLDLNSHWLIKIRRLMDSPWRSGFYPFLNSLLIYGIKRFDRNSHITTRQAARVFVRFNFSTPHGMRSGDRSFKHVTIHVIFPQIVYQYGDTAFMWLGDRFAFDSFYTYTLRHMNTRPYVFSSLSTTY
jgi:hypothetical protein